MLADQEVPADAAYAAAMDRINRMTRALVLSEGARLVLSERVTQLEALAREQRDELSRLHDADERRLREEVTHDAASSEAADAGCEAHPAQGFHD